MYNVATILYAAAGTAYLGLLGRAVASRDAVAVVLAVGAAAVLMLALVADVLAAL